MDDQRENLELKEAVTRLQLGTALALFIEDHDPVSVHCLACGGAEIADFLAKNCGQKPFSQHALETFPEMKLSELVKLRNQYWNAMKHALTLNGKIRSDEELLTTFDDVHNDHVLFVGWYDYATAVGRLPIEAQVFQAWYFANYPDKLADEAPPEPFIRLFPDIQGKRRSERKRLLRRKIAWARKQSDIMQNAKTERRKLILDRRSALSASMKRN
jgi:hypothetical protein